MDPTAHKRSKLTLEEEEAYIAARPMLKQLIDARPELREYLLEGAFLEQPTAQQDGHDEGDAPGENVQAAETSATAATADSPSSRKRFLGTGSSSSNAQATNYANLTFVAPHPCRICQKASYTTTNRMLQPCACKGSIGYGHEKCILQWMAKSKSLECAVCHSTIAASKLYDSKADPPEKASFTLKLYRATCYVSWGFLRLIIRIVFAGNFWLVLYPLLMMLLSLVFAGKTTPDWFRTMLTAAFNFLGWFQLTPDIFDSNADAHHHHLAGTTTSDAPSLLPRNGLDSANEAMQLLQQPISTLGDQVISWVFGIVAGASMLMLLFGFSQWIVWCNENAGWIAGLQEGAPLAGDDGAGGGNGGGGAAANDEESEWEDLDDFTEGEEGTATAAAPGNALETTLLAPAPAADATADVVLGTTSTATAGPPEADPSADDEDAHMPTATPTSPERTPATAAAVSHEATPKLPTEDDTVNAPTASAPVRNLRVGDLQDAPAPTAAVSAPSPLLPAAQPSNAPSPQPTTSEAAVGLSSPSSMIATSPQRDEEDQQRTAGERSVPSEVASTTATAKTDSEAKKRSEPTPATAPTPAAASPVKKVSSGGRSAAKSPSKRSSKVAAATSASSSPSTNSTAPPSTIPNKVLFPEDDDEAADANKKSLRVEKADAAFIFDNADRNLVNRAEEDRLRRAGGGGGAAAAAARRRGGGVRRNQQGNNGFFIDAAEEDDEDMNGFDDDQPAMNPADEQPQLDLYNAFGLGGSYVDALAFFFTVCFATIAIYSLLFLPLVLFNLVYETIPLLGAIVGLATLFPVTGFVYGLVGSSVAFGISLVLKQVFGIDTRVPRNHSALYAFTTATSDLHHAVGEFADDIGGRMFIETEGSLAGFSTANGVNGAIFRHGRFINTGGIATFANSGINTNTKEQHHTSNTFADASLRPATLTELMVRFVRNPAINAIRTYCPLWVKVTGHLGFGIPLLDESLYMSAADASTPSLAATAAKTSSSSASSSPVSLQFGKTIGLSKLRESLFYDAAVQSAALNQTSWEYTNAHIPTPDGDGSTMLLQSSPIFVVPHNASTYRVIVAANYTRTMVTMRAVPATTSEDDPAFSSITITDTIADLNGLPSNIVNPNVHPMLVGDSSVANDNHKNNIVDKNSIHNTPTATPTTPPMTMVPTASNITTTELNTLGFMHTAHNGLKAPSLDSPILNTVLLWMVCAAVMSRVVLWFATAPTSADIPADNADPNRPATDAPQGADAANNADNAPVGAEDAQQKRARK